MQTKVALITLGTLAVAAAGIILPQIMVGQNEVMGGPGGGGNPSSATNTRSQIKALCEKPVWIKWNRNIQMDGRLVNNIRLDLYNGDSLVRTIFEKTPNTGEVKFVPAKYVDCLQFGKLIGGSYNFRISAWDRAGRAAKEMIRIGW